MPEMKKKNLTLCYPTRIANQGEINIEHLAAWGNNEHDSRNASLQRSSILRNAGMGLHVTSQ